MKDFLSLFTVNYGTLDAFFKRFCRLIESNGSFQDVWVSSERAHIGVSLF